METTQELNENPYVAVVSRKVRNLKKKYDRVLQLDTQLKEGKKALNEEQLILVGSKSSLEKALAELDSIKKQLEEVAEQEKRKSAPATPAATAAAVVQETPPPTQMTDSSTFTPQIELVANSTQYEQETESVPGNNTTKNAIQDAEVLRAHLHKILKLFHICSRYSTLSGNSLPADINYFGKCLLGETSIDGFSKTLNQSVRNAELYLDEVLGSQYEAIRGMSYSQISDIIDSLANQLPLPTSPHPPRAPTPPTQSPQINFFADGGLAEGGEAPHLQENYNPPLGSFGTSASPFPLPPSAVVMYDQWNTSESSPPLSPSTLAASALGGVIGSSVTPASEANESPVIDSLGPNEAPVEKEQSGKKGRGQSRDRKGRGRGRGKENPKQGEVEPQAEVKETSTTQPDLSESKKGISWGGQEKKAGGALAAVAGAADVTPKADNKDVAGRGGSGRTRGRGSSGRGSGRGRGADNASGTVSNTTETNKASNGEGGRGAGRGRESRGRGSGRSREGGRGGRGSAPAPATA